MGGEKYCRSTLAKNGLCAMQPAAVVLVERLGVELLDHPEAAKLALGPVPVAVVIAVFGGELALGKMVDDFDARDDLDGKRQRRLPASRRTLLILQIEARRGRVLDLGHRADVVVHLVQQIRLQAAGEIEKEQVVARQAIGVAAPEHAADAAAEHIDEAHGIHVGDRRRAEDGDGIAPAVAALVDPRVTLVSST